MVGGLPGKPYLQMAAIQQDRIKFSIFEKANNQVVCLLL
jgi:hypothetical protein